MAKTLNLDINGKSVTLKFGYGLFRLLGEKWNLPGITAVISRFSAFEEIAQTGELTFGQMEILSDLVITGAEFNDLESASELDPDDICDFFLNDLEAVGNVMALLISSLPVTEQAKVTAELGKKKAPKTKK